MNLELFEVKRRADGLVASLTHCELCPWHCGVDRTAQETGFCRTGRQARVTSAFAHFGEEAPLRGSRGSGTIFFANCNLACQFCQNHDISQPSPHHPAGREMTTAELAEVMLTLQRKGCHNINLVTPTHVTAQITEALVIAVKAGFKLPLVYNSGGYDSAETLRSLDGIIDIYMPDLKYVDPAVARELSGPPDYPERNREAVTEMHRQVSDLRLDEDGIAIHGLLARHLVLPGGLAGTAQVAGFLADLSIDTHLNLMDQYRPCHKAHRRPPLDRSLNAEEWESAVREAKEAGLWRLDHLQ